MKIFFLLSVTLLLSACGWQTNRALLADDPDEKEIHVGSHIPVKDKSNAQATGSGDADAMMRAQRATGAPGGVSGGAARSN
jgi:outer membrane lipopolysaccharide assembly protein LptE/RlpB